MIITSSLDYLLEKLTTRSTSTSLVLFIPPCLNNYAAMCVCRVTLTQYFIFVGLDYSSPILVCAMGHLVPTFSFLFALILRNIKLDLKNRSIQAKMLGTFITVAGAVFVTLYKGHVVRKSSVLLFHVEQRLFIFASTPEHWVIGGILLAGASFSVSIWNIIQLGTLKHYPQVMKVVFFCSLIGTFQCTIISLAFERDLGAWKLRLNTELLLIILTAIFGGVIRSHVQIWCMQLKGPLYATTFKPFGIIYASFFGITFFGNSIYYGSIMGAVIMGIGYYVLVWGPIRDEVIPQDQEERNGDLLEAKVPLLQGDSQV
ncbi:hypothetical protein SAY87_024942 [Trapa incisa]|uniref:WAT1-related protein n=1 Tax=Trapa incisa TaxID=236973 RepID=A0AAN7JFF3_9MYRT|nr:hypothetical protein SAY87_024942 [Trapa incisa]